MSSQGHCFYFSKNNFSVFMYNVCTEIKYSQLDFRVSFFHSILIVVCLYCDVCLNSKGLMSNYFTIIIVVYSVLAKLCVLIIAHTSN